MPVRYNPEVNIFKEHWDSFRSSRTAQYTLLVLVALCIVTFFVLSSRSQSRRAQEVRPAPNAILVAEVETLAFIDSKTGASLIWFYRVGDDYYLFDGPGYDPIGQELRPVTDAGQIRTIQAWAKQELASQSVTAAKALFDFDALDSSQNVGLAIERSSIPTQYQPQFNTTFEQTGESHGHDFSQAVLRSSFWSGEHFDQLYAGKDTILTQSAYWKHAKAFLLMKPRLSFKDATTVSGMRSCQLIVDCCLYLKGDKQPALFTLSSVGAAHSDAAAMTTAIENFWTSNHASLNKRIHE